MKITLNLPESISTQKSIVYPFQVTIKHKCAENTLILSSFLGYQIYYIDPDTDNSNATGNKVITPAINSSIPVATCPLTCNLEYWDSSAQIWVTIATGNPTWVKSFNQAAGCVGIIDIWTKDYLTYHPIGNYPNNSKWTDIELQITLKDAYSHTATNMVQDLFTLSLRRPCSDSTLTQTGDLPAFLYYINSLNSAPIAPIYTNIASDMVTVCVPFFYLHFWDENKMVWVEYTTVPTPNYPFVGTWTAATGTLVINTADFNTWDMTVINVRITAMNSIKKIEDTFYLTIKDKCRDATITTGVAIKALDGTIKTSTSPFLWDTWQLAEAKFAPIVVSTTPTSCPTTYWVTDVNFERT